MRQKGAGMARPDRRTQAKTAGKTAGKRALKTWRQAALGGLLVALGGALLGRGRAAAPPAAAPAAEPRAQSKTAGSRKPKVRTKPRPAAAPVRTRYWPPPAPKPIAPEAEPDPPYRDARAGKASDSAGSGYERSDIRAGTVAKVVLSSAAVLVVAVAGLFMLVGWVQRGARQGPSLTAQQRAAIVPPAPRLQDHPLHDIAMLRQRESDLLDHYAWTDADHRTARIPIARAEALVTGRSLDPAPEAAPDPAAAPVRP